MRKAKTSDELRPVYRREDLGEGVRGKYFESYQKGSNLVLLSPDVAKVFPTEEAVNEALRSLINLAKNQQAGQGAEPDRLYSGLPVSFPFRATASRGIAAPTSSRQDD